MSSPIPADMLAQSSVPAAKLLKASVQVLPVGKRAVEVGVRLAAGMKAHQPPDFLSGHAVDGVNVFLEVGR